MAKLKIKKIEIIAPLNKSKEVIDTLERLGTVEITETPQSEGVFCYDTKENVNTIIKNRENAEKARGFLSVYAPRKQDMLESFKPRKEIELSEFYKGSERNDEILRICDEINSCVSELSDIKAKITKTETDITALEPWAGLDIPLGTGGTEKTDIFMGTLPDEYDEEKLKVKLAELAPALSSYDFTIASSLKVQTYLAFIVVKNERELLQGALREIGFTAVSFTERTTAKEEIEKKKKEIVSFEQETEAIKSKLKALDKNRESIDFLIDCETIRADKYEAFQNVGITESVIDIKGYIPERYAEKTEKRLEEKLGCAVLITEPEEDEDVPVALKNNGFVAPAESVTEMYSMPGKHDIDPTPVMSFFYYCFFGMMLSDAGYGLLMVIATLFVLFKYKPEREKANQVKMYLYCGISTMFWGIMYGSFFGDIINIIRTNFLNLPAIRLYVWMDQQNQLMTSMIWCFLFGIIHLFTGVFCKAITEWKYGSKFWGTLEPLSVFLTVGGAAPIALDMIQPGVSAAIKSWGGRFALAGVILVMICGARGKKGFSIISGALSNVYNTASGFLSDILSYSRLLALGLVTGIIGQVINMMGAMPKNIFVKSVSVVLIFILGHVINFAINIIGAYVHTLRLQYVEFFQKFYEGGGRKFSPLKINTKGFKFKEEQ